MKKALIITACLLFLGGGALLAATWFKLDKIIHTGIEVIGPDATGVDVTADSVHIAPLAGTFGLTMLTMGNPEGYSLGRSLFVRDVKVKIALSSLAGDVIIIEEVILDGADITWEGVRGANHRQILRNIDAYADRIKPRNNGRTPSAGRDKPGRKVIIRNLYVQNSSLDVVVGRRKVATVPLPALHLTDIGKKQGGETSAELIQDTYHQLYEALNRSAAHRRTPSLQDVGEVAAERGRRLLEQTKASARTILEDAREWVNNRFR